MTRQELISRKKTARNSENKYAAAIGVAVLVGVMVSLDLTGYFEHCGAIQFIGVAGLFGSLLGGVVLLTWSERRHLRQFDLLCPKCGKALLQSTEGQMAIFIGTCCHCGETVVDDPQGGLSGDVGDVSPSIKNPLIREELISRKQAFTHYINRHGAVFPLVAIVGFLGICMIGEYFEDKPDTLWSSIWIWLPCAIACLIAALAHILWNMNRQVKRLGLLCPSCGETLMGQEGSFAIATGICGHCGEKIITELQGDCSEHCEYLSECSEGYMTRQELLTRKQAMAKGKDMPYGLFACIKFLFIACSLVLLMIVIGLMQYVPKHPRSLLIVVPCVIVIIPLLVFLVKKLKQSRQNRLSRLGLLCPGCNESLDRIVVLTGNCGHCGRRIIK